MGFPAGLRSPISPQARAWGERHGYGLALAALFVACLALRLWGLDRFQRLIFDELYYVKYGVNYLGGKPLFDAHPPLGKYLIALGIWLGEQVIWRSSASPELTPGLTPELTPGLTPGLAGMALSPYSYRWLNGLVGSCIPLLGAGIGRQLSQRRSLGLVAGLLLALDGLLLVESRFALLHVYLVAFGLLGHWCWLRAIQAAPGERTRWLLNAGLSFGACVSVKWNGLGYWAGPLLFWAIALGQTRLQAKALARQHPAPQNPAPPLIQLTARISPGQMALYLGLVPLVFYLLLWLPHLGFNPAVDLGELHRQILSFHRSDAVSGSDAHPYCSPWWSWPLMIRPMAYAFSKLAEPPTYFAVHALGNPLLWWAASLALALGGWGLLQGMGSPRRSILTPADRSLWIYLVLSFGLNWLPWAAVGRCTFIYHYLGALCFSTLALAWWLDLGLQLGSGPRAGLSPRAVARYEPDWRYASLLIIGLIALAFVFWLPIYLGLGLSPAQYQWRMLLPSWI